MVSAYLQTASDRVLGQEGLHGLENVFDVAGAVVHVLGSPGIDFIVLAACDGDTVDSHLVGLDEERGGIKMWKERQDKTMMSKRKVERERERRRQEDRKKNV